MRTIGERELLARMRRGDLPKRFDYASVKFDNGDRVRPALMQSLIRRDLVVPAPPHIGAAYTLPAAAASEESK